MLPQAPGAEKRHGSEDHEAEPHQRDDANGERAAGDDAGAVKQKPFAGNRADGAGAELQHGQKSADKKRRRESVNKSAAGAGEERGTGGVRFGIGGPGGDGDGHEGFADPGDEPSQRRGLARSDGGGAEGGDAHSHAAPAGNGGERAGAFHGLADEAQVIAGMIVEGYRAGGARATWFGKSHGGRIARAGNLSSTLFHKVYNCEGRARMRPGRLSRLAETACEPRAAGTMLRGARNGGKK
jgi:hypothetical protein